MLKQYLVSTIKSLNTERQPGIVLVKIGLVDTMIENVTSKKILEIVLTLGNVIIIKMANYLLLNDFRWLHAKLRPTLDLLQ